MRLEQLTDDEEDFWRGEFAQQNWIFGALALSVTLPEFAGGTPSLRTMHFGYYLQPLHLNADDREDLPRKLCYVLARRKPPVDFLELSGAGIRIPHAFPVPFHARIGVANHTAGGETHSAPGMNAKCEMQNAE